jgi:cell division protein FtsW (lipid II flippase)
MDSTSSDELKVQWRVPFVVVIVAITAAFMLVMFSPNLGDIAALFVVAPITVLVLLGVLIWGQRTRLVCLALLCFYLPLSWQMTKHSGEIRSEVRWLAASRFWKTKVLQQNPRPESGMKCIDWDGWGLFAQDTEVYLVFSPDDGLRNYSPSKLNGLPAPVWRVQRLEKQWYSVTFYTGEGWDGCGVS